MKIRILSVFLTVALLLSLLPLGAFAETQITQIDVTVEQFPVAWKAPKNLPAPSVGADSGYRITNFEWYDVTDDTGSPMGYMDLFEKDHDYVLYIYLEPLAGYAFAGSPSVAVNGSASLVASCEIGSSGGFFRTRPVTATDPNAPTAITEVNITGFRTPYVGQTAGDNLSSVEVPADAHYEITSLDWQKAENGNFLEGGDDFAAGNAYYVCFVLSPAEGYAFAENCTVLINGAADQVDGDYTRLNGDGTMTFYSVDLEPTVPQVVARIDLTGFVMPRVGQTAGGNLASLGVPDGAGYTVTEAFWRSDGEEMAASDCFTANTTCYICFTVALAEGYVFDFDEGAVVYINGAETLVDSGYTQILTNNTLQCYTVDLTPDAAAGDVLIEEVSINGFTVPQPGDTVSANLALLSLPEGANYYFVKSWYNDTDNEDMGGSDVFDASKNYTFWARLYANSGYTFSNETVVHLNGGTVLLDENNCHYYCSAGCYEIQTVAIQPAALRGDINADKTVNISDVTALLDILAGSGSIDLAVCDIDKDGAPDISDVSALLDILSGG